MSRLYHPDARDTRSKTSHIERYLPLQIVTFCALSFVLCTMDTADYFCNAVVGYRS